MIWLLIISLHNVLLLSVLNPILNLENLLYTFCIYKFISQILLQQSATY